MMTSERKFKVFPYRLYSKSGKVLASEMGAKRLKRIGSNITGAIFNNPKWWVINWGNTECSDGSSVINQPSCVLRATNKLSLFKHWLDIPPELAPRVPPWTTDRNEAALWVEQGKTVVCRSSVTGRSGSGIIFVGKEEKVLDIPEVPLYTTYIKKRNEYRIHVMKGQPIFLQEKRIKSEMVGQIEETRVRSHENGFVLANVDVNPPQDVVDQAVKATISAELDFGAVDVIWNEKKQEAYVLEINTAPGLEGETVKKYAQSFKELF